ncbi:DNA cytosine methyltransferase [Arsenicicoccus cauae]|uniref:DNA cytosine methyltransferase n=1 Tax=Arsenicicoccus cauae TaxID=2663847 RepID=UPI00289DF73D|nr:DNA cytosine methyltransferase [Arsenicicoccus cauae]
MTAHAFTFADLFAGIGGFHAALKHAGGHAVFVSEIDREARETYLARWVNQLPEDEKPVINEDINQATPADGPLVGVPQRIDVLTAGFPCQPFSKSGKQQGMEETRGTLFFNICRILEERRPPVILLENVRNLVGPRHTHEWHVIVTQLRDLGYRVSGTPSVFSPHFLPPSLGGTPQVRDRVFILGTYVGKEQAWADRDVSPTLVRGPVDGWDPNRWRIDWALDDEDEIGDLHRYELTASEREWVDVWDDLVQRLLEVRDGERLPGFPLWADEWRTVAELFTAHDLDTLPTWKADFLVKNARFYEQHRAVIDSWRAEHPEFDTFPPSRRKLEWQAQDTGSLWETVMHFRPSGIRCKRPTYLPALVAITQTSIIGKRERRITPHEAARLQGMPRDFTFGNQRNAASYKQVGNGVCVGAAWYALRQHVLQDDGSIPEHITAAILDPDKVNPSPDSLSPQAVEAEQSVHESGPEPVAAKGGDARSVSLA